MTATIKEHSPHSIVNCIAIPSINPCETEPASAIVLHCNAVLHLANQCAKHDIILVQPSSHAVFDGLKNEAYIEDDLVKATNVYGATKFLSERIAATYCTKHYIPRFPTLYGPRRNKSMGFVDKVIMWIREGRELRIADDKMDSPTYTMDAADKMVSLISEKTPYGIYHIANQGWVSYYDFVLKIREIMKAKNVIHRAKDKEFASICHKPLRTALSSTKIKPLRNYEEALEEYLKDYVVIGGLGS
ncbi:MAG: NAD(P)-dependent oxidoreductase [Deltaproteobacteria bacterium]|nr:MAG: NAD(P)-dependent oxidoreductase [Deltaproteobacteria bacterium]